ncbi:MAG: beta-propeller domain-containing protein [Bdellovibrionota bacterium]
MKVIPIATLFLILSGCSVVGKIFPGMADDNSKPRIIGDQFPDTDENYDKSGFHLTVETYEDCSALQTMVYEAQKAKLANDWEQTVYYAQFRGNYVEYQEDAILTPSASTAAAESSAEVSKSDSESFTNNQEKGIDEADYIKIGNSQIFVLGSKKIAVSNRSGLQYVGKLDLDGLSSPVMYTPKDRLILAGTRSKAIEGKIETNLPNYSYYNTNSETVVRVYDVAQSQLPKLAKEYVFNGNYVDSRLTKGI